MKASIAGFILRAADKAVTADFYSQLGLGVREHEHGGPLHFEVTGVSPDFVVEMYKKTDRFNVDALMVEVGSIDTALDVAKKFGIFGKTEMKEAADMKFIYITDPDGRDVMLIEKK